MSFDNTNKGALFKNDNQTNERQPNLRGFVNIEGREYWVSGWTKTVQGGPRAGQKMISMALEPKDDQPPTSAPEGQRPPAPSQGGQPPEDDFDDDIPFN